MCVQLRAWPKLTNESAFFPKTGRNHDRKALVKIV